MNCKWAEEHLSAYLDDALDPPLSREVGEHVAQCAHCTAILDDYRNYDFLLRDLPRVEPAPELKERIFSSPEMAKLLAEGQPPRRLVSAARLLLPVAALITLALGAALLFKQGLLPSGHPNSPTITTIGNPGGHAPLPAGVRLVYERDGALWSRSADGQGVSQQLTPAGAQVAGWSVAPASGQAGASLVAYIDARTGAIHVIRADGLNDTVIGHVSASLGAGFWQTAAGQAAQAGLAWAPDGTRVAYLAVASANSTVLHVVNVRGAGDISVGAGASGLVAAPVWSADSLYIAFTQSTGGAQSVWAYGVATGQAREVASQAGASATARATHIFWVAGSATPTLTWAAKDGGRIEGIYAAHANVAASTTRLTPAGAHFDAADFATSSNGLWLVASGNALSTVSPSGAMRQVATASAAITNVAWSPTGNAAAVTGANFVATWSADHGLTIVAQGGVAANLVAWSPDGKSLAYVVGGAVRTTAAAAPLAQNVASVTSLRWSPDGQRLAIATPTGVLVVKRDGSGQATIDTHAPTDGALLWTVTQ